MQLDRRHVSLCIAGLLLQGCATVALKPDPASTQAFGSGRFQLSGDALEQPVSGRFEWGRTADAEWVLLGDPWGGALGELRRPLLSTDWQVRDATGSPLAQERVHAWLSDTLGLAAEHAETQLAQLALGFTTRATAAHHLQIQGQRGSIRLRIIPDPH
ncbi:MAG: hypothetical protein RJA77_27 [Pseudomonadota bacterium]